MCSVPPNGARSLNLYHRLKFLPDVVQSDSEVYVRSVTTSYRVSGCLKLHRSTSFSRTIESLEQVINGLYPPPKQTQGFVSRIRIRYLQFVPSFAIRGSDILEATPKTRIYMQTSLHANDLRFSGTSSPKVLRNGYNQPTLFTLRVAAIVAWNPVLEPFDEKISKYIGGNPVRVDGKPRATGILDTVCCISFVGSV